MAARWTAGDSRGTTGGAGAGVPEGVLAGELASRVPSPRLGWVPLLREGDPGEETQRRGWPVAALLFLRLGCETLPEVGPAVVGRGDREAPHQVPHPKTAPAVQRENTPGTSSRVRLGWARTDRALVGEGVQEARPQEEPAEHQAG